MTAEPLDARELGIRSRAAVHARDRDGWLDLFAPDAVVQDPVGPSPLDPEGKGRRGLDAIAAFYDTVIAPSEAVDFEITESYLCGNEVADVGIIRTTLAGGSHQAVVHVVMNYRSDGAGKIASLRAFWEFDKLELVELGELTALRLLVREDLFTDADPPALLGSRCRVCGSTHFPRADACPYCAAEDPDAVELRGPGTLWAWTAVTAPPPGYQGEVPFGVGVVELPEGVRVITRLIESNPAALTAGQAMELRVVPLHRDDAGNDVVTYAFGAAR